MRAAVMQLSVLVIPLAIYVTYRLSLVRKQPGPGTSDDAYEAKCGARVGALGYTHPLCTLVISEQELVVRRRPVGHELVRVSRQEFLGLRTAHGVFWWGLRLEWSGGRVLLSVPSPGKLARAFEVRGWLE